MLDHELYSNDIINVNTDSIFQGDSALYGGYSVGEVRE